MTREEAIKVLQNERECVQRQSGQGCDHNCAVCDLVLPDKAIIDAYGMAISALRDQQVAEKNEPLTLDELREMDRFSPPVWDDCLHDWCAVRPDVCAGRQGVQYIGGGRRPLEEGRFYRHKPKEGTT